MAIDPTEGLDLAVTGTFRLGKSLWNPKWNRPISRRRLSRLRPALSEDLVSNRVCENTSAHLSFLVELFLRPPRTQGPCGFGDNLSWGGRHGNVQDHVSTYQLPWLCPPHLWFETYLWIWETDESLWTSLECCGCWPHPPRKIGRFV